VKLPTALALFLLIPGLLPAPQKDHKQHAAKKMLPVEKRVSVQFMKSTLPKTLKRISQLTGAQLVFDSTLISSKVQGTKQFEQKNATEILNEIIKDFELAYIVKSRATIIFIRKPKKKQVSTGYDKIWKAQLRSVPFLHLSGAHSNGV